MMKLRGKETIDHILFSIWMISVFFDSYVLAYIGTYPITLFTVITVIVLFKGIFGILQERKIRLNKYHKIALFMVGYICLNYLFTGAQNITSFMLGEFFFITYLLTYRKETEEGFKQQIHSFHLMMNIFAVYGIYQLFGRLFSWPFSDLIMEGHMVEGFNWSNSINILGTRMMRSNAIFREPSFFSQYIPINILLYFIEFLEEEKKGKTLIFLIVNAIAMIVSFSGTGFIILFLGGIMYLIFVKKDKKVKGILLKLVIPIVLLAFIFFQTALGYYFIQRSMELFVYSSKRYSGYVRFRSGYDILTSAWQQNFLFGIGIGTVDEFIMNMSNYYRGMTVNGFYRPAVELGLIGIGLWITFVVSFQKKKSDLSSVKMISCIIIPFMICHEVFMSNYYWIFLYLLNCNIEKWELSDRSLQAEERNE